MNEEEERYFDGFEDYYEREPEALVSIFYNSRVSDTCGEIPAPLALRAWEAHEETFWEHRLSMESSDGIWEFLPFL